MTITRLWGGRFSTATDELMKLFHDSIRFDQRMYRADIRGSVAYALALAQAGLITATERDQLRAGLEQVLAEFDTGAFEIKADDEDVHTAVAVDVFRRGGEDRWRGRSGLRAHGPNRGDRE